MDQVRENGIGGGLSLLADYSYDILGRRSNIVRGNGVVCDCAARGGGRDT